MSTFFPVQKHATPYAAAYGIPTAPKGDINMEDYRATSYNQPPRFREAIKTGKVLLGAAISIPSVEVARVTAQLGFDWVWIDCEHTPLSPTLMAEMVRAVNYYSGGTCAPVVRTPTHGHEWITWALDAGAAGVILPHTETVEQAKHAVQSARFGPEGKRSFPPFVAVPGHNDIVPEGKTMFDVWNENAAVIMQIESKLGVENAHAIAAVEGVDAIKFGPGDLRFDMSFPGVSGNEPEFLAAVETVANAGKENGKPILGLVFNPDMVKKRIEQGWRLMLMSGDLIGLISGQTSRLITARTAVKAAHEELEAESLKN